MPSATTKREPEVLIKRPTTIRFPEPKQTDLEMAAGQLTAFHIDRVISFEYDARNTGVYHHVRGVMREAHHSGHGSVILLTGLECTTGDKDEFSLDHHHKVTVEAS